MNDDAFTRAQARLQDGDWCPDCNGVGEIKRTKALPGHALATTITFYDTCEACGGSGEFTPTSDRTGHYVDCDCWGCWI